MALQDVLYDELKENTCDNPFLFPCIFLFNFVNAFIKTKFLIPM